MRMRHQRQGIALIMVLSLLVVFLLMGVSYLMVAGQFEKGARSQARRQQRGTDPRKLLDQAMYQILCDSKVSTRSSISGHSLLEDLYGNDSTTGEVATASATGDEQFTQIDATASLVPFASGADIDGYLNGRVLTMTTGEAQNLSTRIVNATSTQLTIESLISPIDGQIKVPAAGDRFLVNGFPFNGSGAGLDASGNLNAVVGTEPVALMPHFLAYTTGVAANVGGADESYDAVDFQNMFLAMVPPNATQSNQIIPSFHRPSLINYWENQPAYASVPELPRRISLRPDPGAHPNFPQLASLVDGPWDVDNDGDGIPDSIWVDIGLPAFTNEDGRLVKPLAAILIKDLDGRLNLNAHGNSLQALPSTTFPLGRGHGPAEVYLDHAIDQAAVLASRHGFTPPNNGVPGTGGGNADDLLSRIKTLGVPTTYNGVLSKYQGPPDMWGQFGVQLDAVGHPVRPVGAGTQNARDDDPYEMNLSRLAAEDTGAVDSPYRFADVERLLRFHDIDAVALSPRLLGVDPNLANAANVRGRSLFTTDSRHVPVPNTRAPTEIRSSVIASRTSPTIVDLLEAKLLAGGVAAADVNDQVKLMLPTEMFKGKPMNVNRWFGNGRDDNANDVVDEPSEALAAVGETVWNAVNANFNGRAFNHLNGDLIIMDPVHARQIYARHLYCLMMLLVDSGYIHPTTEGGLTATPLPPNPPTSGRYADSYELTARRIAQWAINVVDFRDSDAIMTPFEFDVNPWNGWDISATSTIDGNPDESPAWTQSERRIVWGCEAPDLLITEAVAFHDRRVKDTENDAGDGELREDNGMVEDNDLDQYRLPQGSLFLEFYCPRATFAVNSKAPRELYELHAGEWKLDLGRMVGTDPVWRVAITESHFAGSGRNSVTAEAALRPDTLSFQPEDLDIRRWLSRDPSSTPAADQWDMERFIWFANANPAGSVASSPTRVYWNRLAGSRLLPASSFAVVGPRQRTYFGSKTGANPATDYSPSDAFIDMAATGIGGALPVGTLPIVAAAYKPEDVAGTVWSNDTTDLGIGAAGANDFGVGISVSEPVVDAGAYYPTEPTDRINGSFPFQDAYRDESAPVGDTIPDEPFDVRAGMPLAEDPNLTKTGTTENYKTAILQRLANPLQPYHVTNNPYITVDYMPIDLTVFSGEENTNQTLSFGTPPEPLDPSDPTPLTSAPDEKFDSRERGQLASATDLWFQHWKAPQNSAASLTNHYFNHPLTDTLGSLNSTYVGPTSSLPFSWMAWHNRPFDTPLELMLVPASAPSRLLNDFSLQSSSDPYDASGGAAAFRAPYHHLLNFFQTDSNAGDAAHFYRLFDFVETPSPFVGTERWYRPDSVTGFNGFLAPYNSMSRFRDPGRVNINTIFDGDIWSGLVKMYPEMDTSAAWNAIQLSRQGFGTVAGARDARFPTMFANPVRSANSADLAPPITTSATPTLRQTEPIQATLLRGAPDTTDATLFRNTPLLDHSSSQPQDNTARNPAFRYQNLMRMPNLLTTHSNCFAVWITIGFFETEQAPVNATYPEGLALGQEAGASTGTLRRHRGFYIIDRSIPVAFERGEVHNVDNAVRLRRFIE